MSVRHSVLSLALPRCTLHLGPGPYLSSLILSMRLTHFNISQISRYVTLNLRGLTKSHRSSLPIAQNNNYKSIRLLCSASEILPWSHSAAHYVCVAVLGYYSQQSLNIQHH